MLSCAFQGMHRNGDPRGRLNSSNEFESTRMGPPPPAGGGLALTNNNGCLLMDFRGLDTGGAEFPVRVCGELYEHLRIVTALRFKLLGTSIVGLQVLYSSLGTLLSSNINRKQEASSVTTMPAPLCLLFV
jgi:hypothetical protein